MRGRILAYSIQTNSGEISGDDGNRYTFVGQEWQGTQLPQQGIYVDFIVAGNQAMRIFRASAGQVSAKSKTTAGILALLLGGIGVHKFYLGHAGLGILFLVVTLFTCGFGWFIIGPIALIEGIIYLTKSDEEFEEIYVQGRKSFF